MPYICYEPKAFTAPTLAVIDAANAIIDEYMREGYDLTLRQLYYQFVSRDLIPNTQRDYNRLGRIISEGRLAGLVDWYAIEDRTRNLASWAHWDDPADIVASAADDFAIDRWARQPWRVEVWIEKEALAGVFRGVCADLDVPFFACRGYTSQSEMWRGAMRLRQHAEGGQRTMILHFGDHDPSGIDMTRDIVDRMRTFGCGVQVDRRALNYDQVEEHEPPPNPAKMTDSRFDAYLAEYGSESWELDALDPRTLGGLVREAVEAIRDDELWAEDEAREREARELIGRASQQWARIEQALREGRL